MAKDIVIRAVISDCTISPEGCAAVENGAARHHDAPGVSWRDLLVVTGFSIICALVFNGSNPKGITLLNKYHLDEIIAFVDPIKAFEKQKEHEVIFVDARPTGFYQQQHIAEAIGLPVVSFDIIYDMLLSQEEKGKEIIIYGRTISKRYDEEVASKLALRGHQNLLILNGGLAAWKKGGFPVE